MSNQLFSEIRNDHASSGDDDVIDLPNGVLKLKISVRTHRNHLDQQTMRKWNL